jgi:hypothetical protein
MSLMTCYVLGFVRIVDFCMPSKRLEQYFDASQNKNIVVYYRKKYIIWYEVDDTDEQKARKFAEKIGELRAKQKRSKQHQQTISAIAFEVFARAIAEQHQGNAAPNQVQEQTTELQPYGDAMQAYDMEQQGYHTEQQGDDIEDSDEVVDALPAQYQVYNVIEAAVNEIMVQQPPNETPAWVEQYHPSSVCARVKTFLSRYAPFAVSQGEGGQIILSAPSQEDWAEIESFVPPHYVAKDSKLANFLYGEYKNLRSQSIHPPGEGVPDGVVSFELNLTENDSVKVLTWSPAHYAFVILQIAEIFHSPF